MKVEGRWMRDEDEGWGINNGGWGMRGEVRRLRDEGGDAVIIHVVFIGAIAIILKAYIINIQSSAIK